MTMETSVPQLNLDEATDETFGRIVAEPLEAGFGITIGNALRRTLLSALPGAAITAVRIEGVEHEFTTIPHMKEDVVEFLLNVKDIRIRTLSDRPGKMFLEASGEGPVTAGQIQPSIRETPVSRSSSPWSRAAATYPRVRAKA